MIAKKFAEAASENTGVLVAPPMNFGCSPYFINHPGTLSVKAATLLAVVEDVVRSAYSQGFRKFLIVNGHGGNSVVGVFLYELANELPGIESKFYSWWTQKVVADIAEKYGLEGKHPSKLGEENNQSFFYFVSKILHFTECVSSSIRQIEC